MRTTGKQCGLAATGDYQPSLRSPWLAASVVRNTLVPNAVSYVRRMIFGKKPGAILIFLAPQQNLWVAEVGLRQMIRSVLSG